MKIIAIVTLVAPFVACLGAAPKPIEDGVAIQVAPLSLPGVSKVCYDLRVTNAASGGGEVVWAKGTPGLNGDVPDDDAICSDDYGNDGGGDITYIGPCDADAQEDPSDAAGERTNSITVWFDGLYDGDGDYVDPTGSEAWQNPCPAPLGCTLDVLCEENADALVTFDFTVLRDANQGFFDVGVNFEDIFCSAKLDTCYGDGVDAEHIELLFGADQVRDWTAVFGFACSAGPGDADTLLRYGALAIVCGATRFPIDPTGTEGNHDVTADGYTLNYGIYRGAEQLDCDDPDTVEVESCNKLYWNLAFSLDDLSAVGPGCTLAFSATATDGDDGFTSGLPTAEGVSYPYIDVDAPLTPAVCQHNALNGGRGVGTVYHGTVAGLPAPVKMCSQFDGTSTSNACAVVCPCWDSEAIVATSESIMAGGPGSYVFDFEDDEDEIELELQNDFEAFFIGVEVTDNEYSCGTDGDNAPAVELEGLSLGEYAACVADIRRVVDDPCQEDNGGCGGATPGCEFDSPGESHCVACPCWESAAVIASSETIMSGGPGSFVLELEDDVGANDSEIEMELESDLGSLFLAVESGGGEYFCFAEGDGIVDGEADARISLGEYSACLSDIRTVLDDPCKVDNGGCTGATPACTYDGPGQSHCSAFVCPCWDSAAILPAAQAIIAGGSGTYTAAFENDIDDAEVELELVSDSGSLFLGVENEDQTLICSAEGDGVPAGEAYFEGISFGAWSVCLADVLALADDRCPVNNGGCAGATPGCVYDGPGRVLCVECTTDADCDTANGQVCDWQTDTCVDVCGNGTLDVGEQCDDGNAVDGDGCSNICARPGWPYPFQIQYVLIGQQDATCHAMIDSNYSQDTRAAGVPIDFYFGAGWIANPWNRSARAFFPDFAVGGYDLADFSMHDHVSVAPFVPDPDRAVATYAFDSEQTVRRLHVVQHSAGATQIEGFVSSSVTGPFTSVGVATVTNNTLDHGSWMGFQDGDSSTFEFAAPQAGTVFRFVVRQSAYSAGSAIYRAIPDVTP